MTPKLSPEQRDAVNARPGAVVYVEDSDTHQRFALIPAETFQKVRSLFDPDDVINPEDFYPLLDQAWKPLIEDEAMDVYGDDTGDTGA